MIVVSLLWLFFLNENLEVLIFLSDVDGTLDIGEDEGVIVLVMDVLESEDLSDTSEIEVILLVPECGPW